MNEPISKKYLSAVISFEDSTEKLSSCLQALVNWVPKIIVVLPDGEDIAKQIIDEFRVSVCVNRASTTQTRWEQGLSQINSHWVLLMRSNEIITGKLRKEITDKVKSQENHFVRYPLSPTIVFLKKQLKYPLDWHDSQPSYLTYLSQEKITPDPLKEKHEKLDGQLIRYGESTLLECTKTIIKKSEERAHRLAQNVKSTKIYFLLIRGIFSSIKIFCQVYFLRKGFKEGFEGAAFAVCDAHAELLGYLRYYELYIRGGKNLRNNLSSLKKILIIKLRDIGDNILCTPLIYNLKQHLPDVSISVLTWSYSVPVFEKNPHVDRFFDLPKNPSSTDLNKLCLELNSISYDLVVSTHSGGIPTKLISKIKSSNKINNFYRGRNKLYNILTSESDYYRSSVERDLDCLRSLGLEPLKTQTEIYLSSDEIDWAHQALKARGLDFTKKIVLIHPTAAVEIREWPLKKFNQLIKILNQKENIQLVTICTEAEYSRVKTLLDDTPDLVIFHKITVRQMMAIIKKCDLIIDNDSSPSHVATAFGIPTIVLFSQAIRKIFRPYDEETDQHFVFYNDVDCRECELTYCNDRICLDFSPEEVYTQALKMLSFNDV